MPTDIIRPPKKETGPEFRVTGRFVLVAMLLFFGVIIGVNAVMARLAVSTFGGLETASSYKAGLAFAEETRAARDQDAQHWQVDAELKKQPDGRTLLRVSARDGQGRPLGGLTAAADLRHPTSALEDRAVDLRETAPGLYEGHAEPKPGQWHLRLDLSRGDERLFRSESRVMLR